ncbi:hypothetical protein DPMN_106534 [Dreissena polymorpha]|uniref:Transient receptor ion channel domain-containing protein n=1 Tax=Dreissena polymorpha TaxID=45954 RepID=A0A9D4K585_DREPO|nr:hypothetical protein DPMN_106534 [Dreissena polymorpha]
MTRKSSGRSSQDGAKRLARVTPACIPLHPIKSCNRIEPKERAFLDAAERGDKHTMVRCLQPPSPVNVNCTDMIGRSAIQIAVDNENVEIVEVLLKQKGIRIGDALLYAIREGVYKIVEMLIDHPSITPEMLGKDWSWRNFAGENGVAGESNDYSPDISPMILAAHCNQFEILQLLLMRGGVIDIPHQLSCSCRRCSERVNEDSLRHSIRRINTYRALASPAWVCLTSADPVLTAFRLSWELRNLALRENEFKDTYLELSDQCKKLSCSLLDQCRSTDEVIAVLNKPPEIDESEGEDRDTGGPLTNVETETGHKIRTKRGINNDRFT